MPKTVFDEIEIEFFASRIKQAREEQGWTQRDFAERLGVSAGQVGHLEACRMNPTIITLSGIAEALGKPMRFFIYDKAEIDAVAASAAATEAARPQDEGTAGKPKARERIVIRTKRRT